MCCSGEKGDSRGVHGYIHLRLQYEEVNRLLTCTFRFLRTHPFSLFSSLRRDPVRAWIEYRQHISTNHDAYGFSSDQAFVVDLILASPSRWWQVVLPIAGCPYPSFSQKHTENPPSATSTLLHMLGHRDGSSMTRDTIGSKDALKHVGILIGELHYHGCFFFNNGALPFAFRN